MGILHADGILHQPLVDGFCGMRHVDFAGEVCFGEDVGEGGGVVHVETCHNHTVLAWGQQVVTIMGIESYRTCWCGGGQNETLGDERVCGWLDG